MHNEFGERKFGYNSLDYLCLSVNPLGHATSWEFDRLGNLVRHLMPNQYEKAADDRMGTHFYYDAMDRLVSSADSMGNVLATPRDLYGNIRKEINLKILGQLSQVQVQFTIS